MIGGCFCTGKEYNRFTCTQKGDSEMTRMVRTCRICKNSKLTQHGKANAWKCTKNSTHIFKTIAGNVDVANETFQENYELITDTNDGHMAGEFFPGPAHKCDVED